MAASPFILDAITEEIADLKRSRKAVILAHHYQEEEIQELLGQVTS